MELDVGVPSSSELKILQRLDLGSCLLVLVVCSGIDLGPEQATTGVQAGLVGGDSFPAVLLPMVWNLAEDTDLFVAVGVIALQVVAIALRVVSPRIVSISGV
jgi:hypothetical protein